MTPSACALRYYDISYGCRQFRRPRMPCDSGGPMTFHQHIIFPVFELRHLEYSGCKYSSACLSKRHFYCNTTYLLRSSTPSTTANADTGSYGYVDTYLQYPVSKYAHVDLFTVSWYTSPLGTTPHMSVKTTAYNFKTAHLRTP